MLNISELTQVHRNKQADNRKNYETVLKDCHAEMKVIAARDEDNCWYQVPSFLFGLPSYNIRECTYFIIMRLTKNGFNVKLHSNNTIFISWSKYKPKIPNYIRKSMITETPHVQNIKPPTIMPKKQKIKEYIQHSEHERKKQIFNRYYLPSDNIPQIIRDPLPKRVVDLTYNDDSTSVPLISTRPIPTRNPISHKPIQESKRPVGRPKGSVGRPKKKKNLEIQFV